MRMRRMVTRMRRRRMMRRGFICDRNPRRITPSVGELPSERRLTRLVQRLVVTLPSWGCSPSSAPRERERRLLLSWALAVKRSYTPLRERRSQSFCDSNLQQLPSDHLTTPPVAEPDARVEKLRAERRAAAGIRPQQTAGRASDGWGPFRNR